MKRIKNTLFSLPFTGVLLVIFGVAMAVATFIENDFGTRSAKALVYNARWFEFVLFLLFINLIGSIFRQKMYRKEKLAIFLFHISFIFILLGAAITRYISYEGNMHIREGESSQAIVSTSTYVKLFINDGESDYYADKKVFLAPKGNNRFKYKLKLNDQKIDITYKDFIRNAQQIVVEGEGEMKALSLVFFDGNSRQDITLIEKEVQQIGGIDFVFNDASYQNACQFYQTDSGLYFSPPLTASYFSMMQNDSGIVESNSIAPARIQSIYSLGNLQFVISKVSESAAIKYVEGGKENKHLNDALILNVSMNGETKEVTLLGKENRLGENTSLEIGGLNINMSYGSKRIDLPFAIYLDDFILERYPGSNSPSSYESQVTVIDKEKSVEVPYRIYMNHILNYRGYRFFQSSYDSYDEKGTTLSVNHDAWGTLITYFGYLLMTLGMIATLFTRKSRFWYLVSKKARKASTQASMIIGLLMLMLVLPASNLKAQDRDQLNIDEEHAALFGEILVQDKSGRLEPINTLSSEILRKISRKTEFNGFNSDQVLIGMICNSDYWKSVPMIKVSHPEVKKIIGIEGKYASFNQIVNDRNGYKLQRYVSEAYEKKPAERGKFEKDILAVDERVNISFYIYMGSYLKVFPKENDPTHTWYSPLDAWKVIKGEDSIFVSNIFPFYVESIKSASETGKWENANDIIDAIKNYQNLKGGKVIPAESKVKLEVRYNKINIFNRLTSYYGLIGFLLLILHFISILSKVKVNKIIHVASWFIMLGFVFHTIGLAIRWYISGHAPWSNAYESMVFIAWASTLSGILFYKRSPIALTATALLSSLILSTAHLNWLDPEITNLVPVLKSYWLIIHVAIITSSYGFLGLGAIVSFFSLILMILRTKKNADGLNLKIQEFSYVSESTLIIGLFLLTIGTFLGGVWANESWGRYWGWDPKETWALVTVIVYSFILHMRFIPGLRGLYAYNLAALVGFGSVLMTYFGVNYYLSGMHSYAAGDPVPVPTFVYYTLGVLFIIGLLAFIQNKQYESSVTEKKKE
jgi:cytochrome c-type biogenesis protein CcsB